MTLNVVEVTRFGIVGISSTAVHLTVVAILATYATLSASLIHVIGYLCALGISFTGHYVFTFKSNKAVVTTFMKFFIVSCFTLGLSTLLVITMTWMSASRLIAVLFAAASVPVISYVANREFVF